METLYDRLIQEHQMVADLFQQALRDNSKQTLLKIRQMLDPHMAGEEEIFYPKLEEKEDLKELAEHAYEEHDEARSLMKEVESMEPGEKDWTSKLQELQKSVQHHVQEEETKVFPAAQKVFSDDQAQKMAQQYMEFKKSSMQAAMK
ncbi:MAG: hemerythrin domain-containing protein [Methanosarcina sp.]